MRFIGRSALLALALLAACGSDTRQLLDSAEARWREGKYQDARRLHRLLYERDPRGAYAAQALLKLGDVDYLNLRQIDRAIESYEKLVSEFPGTREELEARQRLADIYRNEIGDLSQAVREYEKILESDTIDNRTEIELRLADTYFRQNDFDRSLRELRRIEEGGVSGHLADQVKLKIGLIYQIRKRYDDARELFEQLANSPCLECRRRAVVNLMETCEAVFDFDGAIGAIRRLDRLPENEERIAREVARLGEKRRRVALASSLR